MPVGLLLAICWLLSAEQTVAPTFLYRHVPAIQEQTTDVTSPTCHYRPIFGEGDSETRVVRGIARFGEVTVDPGGTCELVNYAREEEIYVVIEGKGVLRYGDGEHPVRRHDFMYLAPGVSHGISNDADVPIRFLVFGYRLPKDHTVVPAGDLQLANLDEVPLQTVGGHPPDCQYRLLMGDTESERDRLASAHILTSLFMMEFTPGGTNFPHHHEREEEIYFVDAYFFRLNCTAGFYASQDPSSKKARILAARSLFPRMK